MTSAPPLTAPRWPRPWQWVALDCAAALAFTVILFGTFGSTLQSVGSSPWVRLSVAAALALPVALRRRGALVVLGVLLAESALLTAAGIPPTAWPFLPVAFVLYLVAADHPFRVSVAAIAVALAVLAMVSAAMLAHGRLLHASAGSTAFNGIAAGMAMVSAWAIGRAVRQRRAYTQGQREEQARLAHRELAEARRQVTEERIRIARELHDVVAHAMSVIAVQAGVGGHVIDTQPAQARIALNVIETTTRQALTEMRHLLGVLRQQDAESGESDGPDQQADPTGSAQPAVAPTRARTALLPAPSLADLDQLLAQTARAGVLVHFQVNGLRRELPTGVELTAYRIVQEALTNVVRHAGVPSCALTLGYQDSELCIDVRNRGPRDARPTSGSLRAGGASLAGGARQSGGALRAGHGIIGMRERVSLHGGHFSAAPLPGAGFRVTARLPLDGGEQ